AGAFCVAGRGCFGVQAYLDLAGLPDQVTVDPVRKTFTFSGYRPARRTLAVHLASTVIAPVPVKARATLTGLPPAITGMELGPFDVVQGNGVRAGYRIEPPATLGSLDVRAEVAGLRGHVAVDPVPAAVAVEGTYGAKTRIRVRNSAPVKRLTARVTVPGTGSGELRFGDVPAVFGVDADASAAGLNVPAVTYRADRGTLDGRLTVDGRLADPAGRLGRISLAVTDLAADTTIRQNPDQSIDLVSKPAPTGRIEVRAGLAMPQVPRQSVAIAREVPYTKGFLTYHVGGTFGLGPSSIEDVSLAVRGMSWLRVRPGRIPFGLKAPPALGYLAPGFEGAYDRLDLAASGVDLRPDVSLRLKLSRKLGADVFADALRLTPTDSLAPRRYDQRMRPIGARQEISAAGVRLACLTVATRPGFTAAGTRTGAISLRGSDGPQMVSFLDPGDQVPDYAVDLVTHLMSPFPGASWKVSDAKAGACR
ncbi:hypothetical protein HII36_48020, partial [Nonomuraea sp. NN258]|uniref:hypothetical protein n=1 Tax=Nonomuraea antri TaxID=2730852 RepID=UPI0015693CD5